MKTRFVAAIAAVLFPLVAASVALAGGTPSASPSPAPTASPRPSNLPTLPPNTSGLIRDAIDALAGAVRAPLGFSDNEVVGQVTFYKGYELQVRSSLGKYRSVHLHRGTVINPRGATMQQGQTVDVRGSANSDGSLNADYITLH